MLTMTLTLHAVANFQHYFYLYVILLWNWFIYSFILIITHILPWMNMHLYSVCCAVCTEACKTSMSGKMACPVLLMKKKKIIDKHYSFKFQSCWMYHNQWCHTAAGVFYQLLKARHCPEISDRWESPHAWKFYPQRSVLDYNL